MTLSHRERVALSSAVLAATTSTDDDLAQTFAFTPAELEANRDGRVVDGQTDPLLWTGGAGIGLTLVAIAIAAAAIKYGRGFARWAGPVLCLLASPIVVLLLVVPAVRDLVSEEVAVVEGRVTAIHGSGRGEGRASLQLGGVVLGTDAPPASAKAVLVTDAVYRAYYLRHSRRLLSLERAAP